MKARILGGLLVAALLVAGCNRQGANAPSVQEYEQKRAELLKRTQGPQKAVAGRKPEAATQEGGAGLVATGKGYEYSPTGKRDPFRSFVDEQKLRMARHERGPLEQFDLNQLTVVAVVWGTERPRALVQDPSGRGYVVQVGTPIGKNDGLVLRIGDNAVLVRETYVDYLGAQTTKEIEMRTRPISMTQGG